MVATQGNRLDAILEYRSRRGLASTGKTDADVGVLALARAVNDAAHHRQSHVFNAVVLNTPLRHFPPHVLLNGVRQLLKKTARRAAATRTSRHHRRKRTQTHRLQHFLRHHDFLRTLPARFGRQGYADGVPDSFLQQHGHGCG